MARESQMEIPQFGKRKKVNGAAAKLLEDVAKIAAPAVAAAPPALPPAPPPPAPAPAPQDPLKEAAAALAKLEEKTAVEVKGAVIRPIPDKVDPTLVRILSWKRPHESIGEQNFVQWLLAELKERGVKAMLLKGGNVCVLIDRPEDKEKKAGPLPPLVLFSSHTDTVHSNCNGITQQIMYDAGLGHIFLAKDDPSAGSCLGADDGAGIWIMLEMIKAKVPGAYVFHRGEERGGIGSHMLTEKDPEFLSAFQAAVAFDRRGDSDIITHQGGSRCASDEFGEALALALNEEMPNADGVYKLCKGGTFTDTKVYRYLIPECVNVSVGYENAHSQDEYQNYDFLCMLRDACINLDWHSLPIKRDPKKVDSSYDWRQNRGPSKPYLDPAYGVRHPFYPDGDLTDEEDAAFAGPAKPAANAPTAAKKKTPSVASIARTALEPALLDEFRNMSAEDVFEVCEDQQTAADVMMALFIELEAAYRKIETIKGLAMMD